MVKWWPQHFRSQRIYDLGCRDGAMTWCMSQVADHVWCWDIGSRSQLSVDALKQPNIQWIRPHHLPAVDTVYLGNVLAGTALIQDPTVWLTNIVTWIDAPIWIFREVMHGWEGAKPNSLAFGEAWPEQYRLHGWHESERVIQECTALELLEKREVQLKDNLGDTDQRFFLCKKL